MEGHIEQAWDEGPGYGRPGFGFVGWKYRVIGRYGYPVHHTFSRVDAERHLKACREAWLLSA